MDRPTSSSPSDVTTSEALELVPMVEDPLDRISGCSLPRRTDGSVLGYLAC
jgi:hypothetical protein